MDVEDDEEMDVDDDDGMDDPEVIHPYEEDDPLNRPPPDFDSEPEAVAAPVGRSTLQLLPPICRFSGTFYVGEGSSATDFTIDHCKVSTHEPLGKNMDALHSKVKTLTKQMKDRSDTEFWMLRKFDKSDLRMNSFDDDLSELDSALREDILCCSKMEQLVTDLSRQIQELKKEDAQVENKESREMLNTAQERAEYHCDNAKYYRHHLARVPYDPAADPAMCACLDDPYVMAQDAATVPTRDDDDLVTPEDPQPSEPRGSPRDPHFLCVAKAVATDRAARGDAGEAGGQGGAPPARECSFASYMKCNPTSFHGNEEAVELCRWFEKTKSVFSISECAERNKVANGKSWTELKTLIKEEFCPAEEIQRMESELWNLRVKYYNITAYTQHFNELILLCLEMVPTEKKKIEAYICGLSKNVKGETTSSKLVTLNEAVRMAHTLMEQNKHNNNQGNYRDNNRHHQYKNQRQGNARAMTTAQNERVDQGGPAPNCNRCGVCHFSYCPPKCNKCGKIGHKAKDCKGKAAATRANTQPIKACYECGDKGHTLYRCPKRNNQLGGNAQGRAYVIREAEHNQGPNVMT
ncbi:putative reverse transcriptase domain-containing protein, partial [Tanacetum coccineum]